MAKDINIHIKTPGADQARQQLESVGQSAEKLGSSVEQMGSKASSASGFLSSASSKLAGLFSLTAIVAATAKVIAFFDQIKTRSDEAVRDLENVRKEFEGIFEAMGAVDEKSRQKVMAESVGIFKEEKVSAAVGIPIAEEWARANKGRITSGQMSKSEYDKGLRTMLNWGALHPGTAAVDLTKMLPGWNVSADVATRMISATAEKSGLQENDVTEALSRSQSTAQMMGWSLEKTLETIGNVAAGESGRMKTEMPRQAIEALGSPTIPDAEKLGELFGIKNKRQQEKMKKSLESQNPQDIAEGIRGYTANMAPNDRNKFLTAFYGAGTKAVLKSWAAGPDMGVAIKQTAGPAAAAASAAERQERLGQAEAQAAETEQVNIQQESELTPEQKTMMNVRKMGEKAQEMFGITAPVEQKARELLRSKNAAKEDAAMRRWMRNLSAEEKANIIKNYKGSGLAVAKEWFLDPINTLGIDELKLKDTWEHKSIEEKYEGIKRGSSGVTIINDNSIHYIIGGDSKGHPRADPKDLH